MHDLFWEWHARVYDANNAAHRSESKAMEAQLTAQRMEAQVHRLTLINQALWSLLKEHVPLTDDDLKQRVNALDAADGHLDGRTQPVLQSCPQCTRTLSRQHHKCLFCGYQAPATDGFLG